MHACMHACIHIYTHMLLLRSSIRAPASNTVINNINITNTGYRIDLNELMTRCCFRIDML